MSDTPLRVLTVLACTESDNEVMDCRHCPHPKEAHTEHGCRIKIGLGLKDGQFASYRNCACPGLESPPVLTKPNPTGCPHELNPDDTCVHCGATDVLRNRR